MLVPPDYDWTVEIANQTYGLIGMHGKTLVFYGVGNIFVPLPAPLIVLSFSAAILVLLLWLAWWRKGSNSKND
jgi:hypothetical protein